MRGYAALALALGAFFGGLGLEVSGVAPRGLDLLVVCSYGAGAVLAGYSYARGRALLERRGGVIGLGLNLAALVLHVAALL
ncbi:MAG TPA: hypothetical protein VKN99_18660 [Polyangia bacterium]|nr:hypothetical protein [Polyangia bacterium]